MIDNPYTGMTVRHENENIVYMICYIEICSVRYYFLTNTSNGEAGPLETKMNYLLTGMKEVIQPLT